jgi:hypothetical protein
MCDRSHLAYETQRKELRALRDALFDELDAFALKRVIRPGRI